jgi:Na+/H+ antiporter NhaD/arsenite permease-like protein
MVPFVLSITRRLGLKPVPYLLAVATASNIGSVATITGNPQNMLIGSFSRIGYSDFLLHLAPVAAVGLLLDWLVLHWVHMRKVEHAEETKGGIPLPPLDPSRLTKPVIVVTAVVVAFFAGVPPAMGAALGAAVLLISRTLEPRKLYDEVDWGLLVFFVGLFLIVGGAENAGIVGEFLRIAERWNLHKPGVFTVAVSLLSNVVSNVPAVMLLKSLVPNFANPHTGWLVLAMSATLAGNLTITGSIANIIVVETAKPETKIGFWEYFRVGLPITVMTLIVGWAWLEWIR